MYQRLGFSDDVSDCFSAGEVPPGLQPSDQNTRRSPLDNDQRGKRSAGQYTPLFLLISAKLQREIIRIHP